MEMIVRRSEWVLMYDRTRPTPTRFITLYLTSGRSDRRPTVREVTFFPALNSRSGFFTSIGHITGGKRVSFPTGGRSSRMIFHDAEITNVLFVPFHFLRVYPKYRLQSRLRSYHFVELSENTNLEISLE